MVGFFLPVPAYVKRTLCYILDPVQQYRHDLSPLADTQAGGSVHTVKVPWSDEG
jgi:hypothetical protein